MFDIKAFVLNDCLIKYNKYTFSKNKETICVLTSNNLSKIETSDSVKTYSNYL